MADCNYVIDFVGINFCLNKCKAHLLKVVVSRYTTIVANLK